ncbi:hypothetical protein MKW94_010943 [Papaver nudicaule]|uniref:FAD dependent oxidoreductase domain-containing protein n=1 Tax=Papaver nudicaule TaxID=74823 RepID=A0AA41UYK9_PAPNU|nr:hypothetical protein [Papaver nudicaule]
MMNMMVPSSSSTFHSSTIAEAPLKLAVLGAGFAGLSVVWNLLQHTSKHSRICIDIYDEVGIGGGASGISGGLLHPYSPKAKLLWKGAECWKESLNLLNIAERANVSKDPSVELETQNLVWRRGILRPVTNTKNSDILKENSQDFLESCRLISIDKYGAQKLVPGICAPLDSAIYMPQAVNVHPPRYLQALFKACKTLVNDLAALGYDTKEINLLQKSVNSLLELAGEYNAVIVCLGAKADIVQELSGKIPLRTCRGVVAHLQLPRGILGKEYGNHSPSILSDAWLAIQGPRNLVLGSTWDWDSRNYSPHVSASETSKAVDELIPKASAVYPSVVKWDFTGARAGVRSMPPLTPNGSIPLLGCVDDIVFHDSGNNLNHRHSSTTKYWLFGGLGARGLLYHGWLGKLMAQAVLSRDESLLPSELTSWRKSRH